LTSSAGLTILRAMKAAANSIVAQIICGIAITG
jgi:hypothetical protein